MLTLWFHFLASVSINCAIHIETTWCELVGERKGKGFLFFMLFPPQPPPIEMHHSCWDCFNWCAFSTLHQQTHLLCFFLSLKDTLRAYIFSFLETNCCILCTHFNFHFSHILLHFSPSSLFLSLAQRLSPSLLGLPKYDENHNIWNFTHHNDYECANFTSSWSSFWSLLFPRFYSFGSFHLSPVGVWFIFILNTI